MGGVGQPPRTTRHVGKVIDVDRSNVFGDALGNRGGLRVQVGDVVKAFVFIRKPLAVTKNPNTNVVSTVVGGHPHEVVGRDIINNAEEESEHAGQWTLSGSSPRPALLDGLDGRLAIDTVMHGWCGEARELKHRPRFGTWDIDDPPRGFAPGDRYNNTVDDDRE